MPRKGGCQTSTLGLTERMIYLFRRARSVAANEDSLIVVIRCRGTYPKVLPGAFALSAHGFATERGSHAPENLTVRYLSLAYLPYLFIRRTTSRKTPCKSYGIGAAQQKTAHVSASIPRYLGLEPSCPPFLLKCFRNLWY